MKTYNSTNLDTIGGLHDALADVPAKSLVYIDGKSPTALSSYRGYYDQLAIERSGVRENKRTELDKLEEPFEMNMAGYGIYAPGHSEVRIKTPATVAELRKALALADGSVFEGYKGGQYLMQSSTDLWVSENGECSQLQLASVTVSAGRVDFATTEVSW